MRQYRSYHYPSFSFSRVIIKIFFFLVVLMITCFTLLPSFTVHAVRVQDSITVQITGSGQPPGFSPAFLTLHVNTTVIFINHGLPAKSYTLHADDGSFSSPPISPGGRWTITFHTPGSHTYRDTSATQSMVGELLVVNTGVSLLATPDPRVEATVTALIKNGQNPPDTIIIPTPRHTAPPPSNSLIPLIILIVGLSVSLTLLSVLGVNFYRRYRQQVATTPDDATTAVQSAITPEPDDSEDLVAELDDEDSDSHLRIQHIRSIMDTLRKNIQARSHSLLHKNEEDEDEDLDDITFGDEEDEDSKSWLRRRLRMKDKQDDEQ